MAEDNPIQHHQYRIDLKPGRFTEVMFNINLITDFPVIDPAVNCEPNLRLLMMSSYLNNPAPHAMFNCVCLFDYRSETVKTFRHPDNDMPNEHLIDLSLKDNLRLQHGLLELR